MKKRRSQGNTLTPLTRILNYKELCTKKIVVLGFLITLPLSAFALDLKYAPIVNAALSDLKTKTKLSLLQGHVTIHITSGNRELDKQFDETLQNAYPNFTYKEDTVWNEDLYRMTVQVYRENDGAVVYTVVRNFRDDTIAERTVRVQNVSTAVMESLHYKTALAAKNEFEAYLDAAFGGAGQVVTEAQFIPPPVKPPLPARAAHLWTAGAALGSSFAPPLVIVTARVTLAPFRFSFLEAGCDFGFVSGAKDVGYYSFYPFVHYAFYLPLSEKAGWHIGGGGGWLIAHYTFPEGEVPVNAFAFDALTGVTLWNFLNVSYTLRTNFSGLSHKLSVGCVYRF